MNLRKAARGENCEVRSPVCNFNPETTVLAHYRLIGISGGGMKSPDLIGAHACSDCHDLVDGRRHIEGYTRTDVQLLHLQGVVRTQAKLIRRGYTFARGQHVERRGLQAAGMVGPALEETSAALPATRHSAVADPAGTGPEAAEGVSP